MSESVPTRGVFVPVEDLCQVCGGKITWMEGGLFWMHYGRHSRGHTALPVRRTDLEDFTGCRLHGGSEQWWICTCNTSG